MQVSTVPASLRRSKRLLASTLFSVVGGLAIVLLLWSSGRGKPAKAETQGPFQEQTVQFECGKNKLAGTLVLPTRPGPHPTVVFLTQGGPTDRTGEGIIPTLTHHLAAHGVASLSWDRPGVGQSTGDHEAQTIADRADEALAALRFLGSRTEIRRGSVGLAGVGEGGVAAPLAASRSEGVSFLIAASSCQLLGWEHELYRIEHELQADQFPEATVTEALEFVRYRVDVLRNEGGRWTQLNEFQKTLIGRPWFEYVRHCERHHFDALRARANYDPAPSWEKVRCGVLAIYGATDPTCPVEPSVLVVRQGLAKANNADLTVKVVPQADHLLRISDTGGRKEAFDRAKQRTTADGPELAPGIVDTMTSWVLARVQPSRAR
jgi:pimeloyl-ACP methyl ester carboxylesterase